MCISVRKMLVYCSKPANSGSKPVNSYRFGVNGINTLYLTIITTYGDWILRIVFCNFVLKNITSNYFNCF